MLRKISFFFLLFSLTTFSTANAKLNIAYIEGGDYVDYPLILNATIEELANLGLIEIPDNSNLPANFTSKDVWDFAAENATSKDIEFVKDAYYTGNWDKQTQVDNITNLQNRISSKDDIDLIFAFGTQAGIDTTKNIKNVNIMNFSTTDPISAGISKSVEDSGSDYVHAKIEPERYLNQISLFNNIFQFENLGICYEDSESGRNLIAYPEIVKAAELYNFNLIEGKMPVIENDLQASIDARISCHKQLATRIDAMYLTFGLAGERNHMVELLAPFIDEQIPTFAQTGPEDVKYGALLSMATADFNDMGAFEAFTVKQIVEGKKPREISQVYEGATNLALNLTMAFAIGWDLPFELLAAVDEIYEDIKNADSTN